ncbi:Aminoacyl-tRNA synthetase, partial [uncultured virus]
VFIQLSTDEKYLRDNLSFEQVEKMAIENTADIMSLGFNPERTRIISNFEAIKQLYPTIMAISRNVTVKQMTATFGVKEGDKIGNYYFPAVEAAPAFSSSLKGIIDGYSRCLVVLGLDQVCNPA